MLFTLSFNSENLVWKVPVGQMLDLAGNKLNKYSERKRMSNGTHVGLIPIKTHGVSERAPMSNVRVSRATTGTTGWWRERGMAAGTRIHERSGEPAKTSLSAGV